MLLKKLFLLILSIITLSSCSKSGDNEQSDVWASISPETETTIEVWAWNVAAEHLVDTIPSFNEKYPKIKVNVTEFGNPSSLKQKLFVALGADSDMPNLVQISDSDVPLITDTYHKYILDLKEQMPDNWSNLVSPSKISTSFDSTGKQVAMPFGVAAAALFYREDLFQKAGISTNDIITWDGFIEAGKKLQAALPNTKMIGFTYPKGYSDFIRAAMLQQGKDYFTKDGKIAISSEEAIEASKLLQRFINEGIAFDTTDWTGTIRASKTDDIATHLVGIWWGGTLKDQAPEMKGKWKATVMPIIKEGDNNSSVWGGASGSIINVGDPIKQTAALEFAKNAMMTVENQMLGYKKYGLVPTYLPTYEAEEFYEADQYFGEGFNELLSELIKNMPTSVQYTEIFHETVTIMESAYQEIVNNNTDPKKVLEDAAKQLQNSTGVEIAQ